jgi:hypothetical protein
MVMESRKKVEVAEKKLTFTLLISKMAVAATAGEGEVGA